MALTKLVRRLSRAAHLADEFWTAGARSRPECIVLDVETGVPRSPKPPVRIFLGTEPRQYRAERVFIWSILQVRDPARVYEIYLMKDIGGFDRRLWLTGFTNYRFAIPHWAGGTGRAIYNDVDQTYHSDPAELFDLDMDGHGYLAVSPKLTAVMLIDCARMASVWTLDDARAGRRKQLEVKAAAVPNLWGELPGEWHARDEGYVPGVSKCLHYTTIHAQPWHPVPERYVYLPNSVGEVWHELERSADRAGFKVFTADHPSRGYTELVSRIRTRSELKATARPRPTGLDELLREVDAGTILDHGLVAPATETADAAICIDELDFLPNDDVPWFVESLFDRGRRAVYAAISAEERTAVLADGTTITSRAQPLSWWMESFHAASARRPEVRWRVAYESRRAGGRTSVQRCDGGGRHGSPKVWILADDKPAHTNESVALAAALRWPYEIKHVHFNLLNRLSNRILGASLLSLDKRLSMPLVPPWPDVVIAAGRRTAPIARWIGQQTHGRTRLIQLGRKGGDIPEAFDVVVTYACDRLPVHRHRIETALPLSPVTAAQLVATKNVASASRPDWLLRLRQWVVDTAYSRPRKAKGTVRPQQGLEYVCARLIQRGIVRPPRDLKLLHASLGAARGDDEPRAEAEEVAERIREMLGLRRFVPTAPAEHRHRVAKVAA